MTPMFREHDNRAQQVIAGASFEAGISDRLAGSDKTYAAWGADAIAALREAGATHVIIAGKPDAVDAEVDDAASMGVDALAFLTATREKLS